MTIRYSFLLLPVLLLLLSACAETDNNELPVLSQAPTFEKEGTLSFIRSDGSVITTIAIEIAATDSATTRGLMRRDGMGYNRGMLFVFETADTTGFWMKNTPMPLDIIFVGPDGGVVSIAERTTPLSRKTIYYPGAPKQFVVEVRAGFAERFGITEATRIRWQRE